MLHTTWQTNKTVTLLRHELSISALRRPHADSLEAIRDYVKARKKERNTINNTPHDIARELDRPRPLWVCASAPVKGKEYGKIYTAHSNIQPEDKPAFRHDSLFLFDTLSEDYSA